MKVNKEQIEKLYAFTRAHYVEFYDLQTELVDHLAMGIEQQWEEHPDLSFQKALDREFKKFGVFGFMDVLEKRQAAMGKRYRNFIWQHLKAFFTWPKIGLIIIFSYLTYILLSNLHFEFYILQSVLFTIGLIMLIYSGLQNSRKKKLRGADEPIWMLENIIQKNANGLVAFWFIIYVTNLTHRFHEIPISQIHSGFLTVFSFVFVLTGITIYVMQVEIPKNAKHYLRETYPEYNLV